MSGLDTEPERVMMARLLRAKANELEHRLFQQAPYEADDVEHLVGDLALVASILADVIDGLP